MAGEKSIKGFKKAQKETLSAKSVLIEVETALASNENSDDDPPPKGGRAIKGEKYGPSTIRPLRDTSETSGEIDASVRS